DGCSAARVGLCDDISGAFTDVDPDDGSFALEATLPAVTASGVGVCAELRDEAGNVATESAQVNVRVDPPVVSFLQPTAGASFNVASGGCDTSAVVSCSEDGAPVELFADGVSQDTSVCTGNEATFSLSLLSKNDGSTTVLSATQTAQGVTSLAASVTVQADCEPPLLSVAQPLCNSALALRGNDTNPSAPGLQLDVNVANGGVPDVTLSVTAGGTTELQASGNATSTDFLGVNLGGAGSASLVACATDPQGNLGCTPSCPLTVVAEPSIAITSPRPPAAFTIEHDCDPVAPGLQIQVDGTTNAVDGSPVELTIGTGSTLNEEASNGRFSGCVGAPDGEDQVLTVAVTDTDTGLSASTSIIVSVNTSPPPAIGAPSFVVTGRREGTLQLTWNSVLDASNDPLVAYHLRCSRTDITTEALWDAATVFPVSVTPAGAANIPQTQGITNFRTGLERFCMVRGQDAYGQMSPLSGDDPTVALVSNPFLTLPYNSVIPTTISGIRVSVAALGDINGDGQNDFAYGTQNGGVEVFFGGPDLDPSPDVIIPGPPQQTPAHEFGANVVGLGDINGDGRPDFAISARILSHGHAPLGGSVFIFFGRASSAEWAALAPIALSPSPGCGADLCFHSSDASAALGGGITSTDFNGDGEADLVVGAHNRTADDATQRVGRVYVVLGGSQLAAGGTFELGGTALNGFIINPPSSGSRNFGINIAASGLGNDTRGDLVISALGRNVGGENINAELFFVPGRAHPGLQGMSTFATGPAFAIGSPNNFGNPMRAVGDVNDDGFDDVWVSTNFDLNGVSPIYLGRSTGFSGVSLFGYTNDVVDNEWGAYVATGFHTELGRLGDLDDNGFDDVLIGSAFANGAPGTADLFYSDATTQNRKRSAADVTFDSGGNGQMTPSFVGDIDGDGFRDIVILDSGSALPATTLTLYY
ncbi:MAG TPA: FG-GAP-like repeat-containing protein, partial [Polyangiaceae bacterium]|nr:FG-GAP-like repeat-containing protein [Polyangiaceae bacterium]